MATNEFKIVGVYDDEGLLKGFKAVEKSAKDAEKKASAMAKTFQKLGGVLAGVFAVGKIVEFTKNVTLTRAEFQKFAAVLTNTLGSKSKAQKSLEMIQKFAADTPFAVTELTDSFVKLANQGFIPTEKEMNKLGDLASAMGKSFDQLTEGIIDAQTGEFERLKEFGIRASKQGDQVEFTFKGVKKQVDFTSKSIQEYIIGLGDLQGVSGGMAAISKTLGGQISNAGDAIDSFLNSLGQRGEGILGSTVSLFTSLVKTVEDWVRIPVSENIKEEQLEMNVLANRLADVNTSSENRVKIVKEINDKYPKLLENINTEKLDTATLAKNLKTLNEAYFAKIVLQSKQEAIQRTLNEKASLAVDVFNDERKLQEQLVQINKDKKLGLKLVGKSLSEQVKLVTSVNNAQIAGNNLVSQEDQINIQLGVSLEKIKSSKTELLALDKQIKELTAEQVDLTKQYGEQAAIVTENNAQESQEKRDLAASDLDYEEQLMDEEVEANSTKNLVILANDRAASLKKRKMLSDELKARQKLRNQANTVNQLAEASSAREGLAIVLKAESQEAVAGLISSILKTVPFPFNLLVAAGAQGLVNGLFKNIQGFQDGGLIGGNSFSGDRTPILANAGERVLNIPQQEFVVGSQRRLAEQMAMLAKNQQELLATIQENQETNIVLNTTNVASDYVDVFDRGVNTNKALEM